MNSVNPTGFEVIPFFRLVGLGWVIAAVFASPLAAGVTQIDSGTLFADSIHLSLQELVASPTTPVTINEGIYSDLGLSVVGEGSSRPGGFVVPISLNGQTLFMDVTIQNSSSRGSSANEAMIIRFRHPVSRIGMRLGNGESETIASLRAYGLNGDHLGSVERTDVKTPGGISTPEDIPFLGLESTTPVGTVVLDYGPEPAGEQIHDLYFDYAGDRSFVTFLPQVADGQAGEATVRTIFQVQNPYQMPILVRVDFLAEGHPLELTVGDERLSSLSFELLAGGSSQIETAGTTSPIGIGFARVQSGLPLRAQALFLIQRKGGEIVQESGFQSTSGGLSQMVPIEVNRETGLDTGIAIANESDFPVRVTVDLHDPLGKAPSSGGTAHVTTIAPRSQKALFVTEIFTYFDTTASFIGNVRVGSGAAEGRALPVVVSGLRTIRGIAVSSIPAVGTSE